MARCIGLADGLGVGAFIIDDEHAQRLILERRVGNRWFGGEYEASEYVVRMNAESGQ